MHGTVVAPLHPDAMLCHQYTLRKQAGDAIAHAVLDEDVVPGAYYDRMTVKPASAAAQDPGLQAALWEVTQNVLMSGGDLQRAVDM